MEDGTASSFLDSVLCCLVQETALCAQPCPEYSRGTVRVTATPWAETTRAVEGRTQGKDPVTLPVLLVLGLLTIVALVALGCWFVANADRLLRGRRTPVNVVKPCPQLSQEGPTTRPVSSATPVSVTA